VYDQPRPARNGYTDGKWDGHAWLSVGSERNYRFHLPPQHQGPGQTCPYPRRASQLFWCGNKEFPQEPTFTAPFLGPHLLIGGKLGGREATGSEGADHFRGRRPRPSGLVSFPFFVSVANQLRKTVSAPLDGKLPPRRPRTRRVRCGGGGCDGAMPVGQNVSRQEHDKEVDGKPAPFPSQTGPMAHRLPFPF